MGIRISNPDPFILADNFAGFSNKQTLGHSHRPLAINPALRTLVLLTGGQSLGSNVCPTLYLPSNSAVIDQLNIYDGAGYNIAGPLLGATYNNGLAGLGPGNIFARVADAMITNGSYDHIIVVCTNVGSTTADMWAVGIHSDRLRVAMGRLAARGIVPGMTGVTFACIFDIGENDLVFSTSQASMASSLGVIISNLRATGFNGKILIPLESGAGQTSNPVRSAQAAVVDGVTVFGGVDFDAIVGRADGVHWNDTGAASAAAAVVAGFPY